jgi:DNA-binding MarR family transcriptional regulator
METNDFRTYRLLSEIDKSPPPSQRELAQKLNISLGLVNAFIKRLARKGYFKITTIPKNRVKYILTPTGAAEKARLTYEYIHHSFRFYRNTRRKLKALFSELEHRNETRIVFYGVSELAEIAYVTLQETKLDLIAVADEKHSGVFFLNQLVISPDELFKEDFNAVLVTMVDPTNRTKKPDSLNAVSVYRFENLLM